MRLWSKLSVMLSALLSVACSVSPPKDIKVVTPFDSQRYLGTWYEIARLDHRFERGLQQVTAHYGPRADGGLKVINRGFNAQKQQWQESEGKAYFIGSPQVAALKVSFFGPFYGGYNVIALDKEYRHALVCGPDRDYLWLLARTPKISPQVKQQMLDIATRQGFDVSKLIWVNQRY